VLTSVTGFFFPFDKILPSHIVGVISLVVLAIAILALYALHLAGPWRWIYVVSAVLALYLNVFVGVVQAFQKLPFLASLAPTQSEPPFLIAQAIVLVIFVVLGVVAVRSFHPPAAAPAPIAV
jgi:ABC-type Na+ efflux pump permease subunit